MFLRSDDGNVIIDLKQEDFDRLLLVIGYASGAAFGRKDDTMFKMSLKLANTINQGNPNWVPYDTSAG